MEKKQNPTKSHFSTHMQSKCISGLDNWQLPAQVGLQWNCGVWSAEMDLETRFQKSSPKYSNIFLKLELHTKKTPGLVGSPSHT